MRNKKIQIRLSESEYFIINKVFKSKNINLSDFVRNILLDKAMNEVSNNELLKSEFQDMLLNEFTQ